MVEQILGGLILALILFVGKRFRLAVLRWWTRRSYRSKNQKNSLAKPDARSSVFGSRASMASPPKLVPRG